MKTNYFFIVCLMCTSLLFAQNNDFNNQGGDFIWSNPTNWSLNAVPVPSNTVRLPVLAESQVDVDYTITKIQTVFATANANPGSIVPVAGSGTLTINGTTNNFNIIENVSNNDAKLTFRGNVVINNSAGGFTQMRNLNGVSNSIDFDAGSTLTITTNLATILGSSPSFNYDGTIAGTGNLRLGPGTVNTFGTTAANSGWGGDLVFLGNVQTVVNTVDNSIFYDGPKIQVNGTGSSIELNGANVFAAGIVVGGSHTFTFTANKNQSDMTTIAFDNNGTLNLVIDDSVTNLSFEDNSEAVWNAGTVNITGFKNGVIRFGTDNTGLTEDQLSQITADNGVTTVALDNNGFLVDATTLSIGDFEIGKNTPIIQSTLATSQLYFNTPQNNVKIVDISGRIIFNKTLQSTSEIDINFLSPGNYFAIFDDNVVERFIKK